MHINLENNIEDRKKRHWYIGSMIILAIGVLVIVYMFIGAFKTLVDFATTFSFLSAPILAWLIHRSIMSDDIPNEARPSKGLIYFSSLCTFCLGMFALSYLYILLTY